MTKTVKLNVWKKMSLPLTLLCIGGLCWSFWTLSQNAREVNALHRGSNSLSICFERVGQSFMGVMLKDFSNPYLKSGFLQTTKDCLEELKEQMESQGVSWAAVSKKLNYLLTDYHWFSEDVEKISEDDGQLASPENISNIMSYFQKVEGHKNTLLEMLEKKEMALQPKTSFWILSMLFLGVLGFYAFSRRESVESLMAQSEERGGMDQETMTSQINNVLGSKGEEIPASEKAFDMDDLYTPDMEIELDSLNLNLVTTGVLAVLGNRAFAYGIMLDFDVSEDIYVKTQEDNINQMVYSLVIYLMNRLKDKEGQRKVKLHGKIVDKRVEFSIKADGLQFNPQELNYINLRSHREEDMLGGELKVCREILDISDLSLKLVNGMIDSEGYAKFILRMRKGKPKKLFLEEERTPAFYAEYPENLEKPEQKPEILL